MYVIQEGQAEVLLERDGSETLLRIVEEGEMFGEMALFEQEARSASVRARGPVRVLTLEKRSFFRRIHEDPSLAFRVLEIMSRRIRELSEEVARLKKHK